MKKKIQLLLIAFLVNTAALLAQSSTPGWPEMKNFHHFISTTFHPSEEGNLAPVKEKADSMVKAAQRWQASPIPADYKQDETKKALDKLVAKCKQIKASVLKNVADEELKKQLSECHDIFHTIVKECRKAEEKQ